jgi:hypothetical protein
MLWEVNKNTLNSKDMANEKLYLNLAPGEDKYLRFLCNDKDGNPYILPLLAGYAAILYDEFGREVFRAGTLPGFQGGNITEVVDNVMVVKIDSATVNVTKGLTVYAQTVMGITDPNFTGGIRHIYSEKMQLFEVL